MKVTEQSSNYTNLDKMTTRELLEGMNREDRHVPEVVAGCIPQIEKLVEGIVPRVKRGGRVFYVGAGSVFSTLPKSRRPTARPTTYSSA